MKEKLLRRNFQLELTKREELKEGEVVDENKITFSFSSEVPVERWFGKEILSHAAGSANLERFNASASALFNHNWNILIGRITKSWIGEDKRGYVEIEFATNPEAQEKKKDILGGYLRNVSFGYIVDDIKLLKSSDNGAQEEYIATKWTPYEVSFVTVPADFSVGIGRDSRDQVADETVDKIESMIRELKKEKEEINLKENNNNLLKGVNVSEKNMAELERERIKTIQALDEKFGDKVGKELARQLIDSDKSVDEIRSAYLEKLGMRQVPVHSNVGDIDLTTKEKKSYSLIRAINAKLDNKWDKAGFERECSEALAKLHNKDAQGFFMPMNLNMNGEERSTYAVGAAGTGGNLVATDLMSQSFVEILRNKALVLQMGAFSLSGLVGNVSIPRRATAAQIAWVTEGNAPAQSEGTFDLINLAPKTAAGFSKITRQMLMQGTPDIEMLARLDLIEQMALAIDIAAINGSGASGQPLGIMNQSGIGSVIGGTNGAAITIDHVIDLETAISDANADAGKLAYMANAKTVGALKKLKSTTGEYLWSQKEQGMIAGTPGMINGYPVARTNQMPKNLTKGTASGICSALIFGNWADLIIAAWGALDIVANPYGAGFNAGTIELRSLQTIDVGLRQKASFAAMSDALTA